MKKSVAKDASTSERRITRSMTKSDVVLDRNNQVVRKKIKSGKEVMPFLPEEIVYKILLLLPAKVLCDFMKLVCRLWGSIIRNPIFIRKHFSQSPNNSPFLVVSYNDCFELHFINKDETTWNFVRKINQRYLTHGSGLILTADLNDPTIRYLLNPSTNQIVRLPEIRIEKYWKSPEVCVVAYSPLTPKCKVFCTNVLCTEAYILTVGIDNKWRKILMGPYESFVNDVHSFFSMHGTWGYYNSRQMICKRRLALDLEKEIFYEVDFSNLEVTGQILYSSWVSSDMIVSVAIEKDCKCWHFWELVDYKNGGKWRKLGSFDSESKLSEIKKIMRISGKVKIEKGIRPEVITKGGDEVIFKSKCNRIFAYNFKTGTVSDTVPNPAVLWRPGALSTLVFSNSLFKSPGRSIKSIRRVGGL